MCGGNGLCLGATRGIFRKRCGSIIYRVKRGASLAKKADIRIEFRNAIPNEMRRGDLGFHQTKPPPIFGVREWPLKKFFGREG